MLRRKASEAKDVRITTFPKLILCEKLGTSTSSVRVSLKNRKHAKPYISNFPQTQRRWRGNEISPRHIRYLPWWIPGTSLSLRSFLSVKVSIKMATPITVATALSWKIGIIFHLAAPAVKRTMSFESLEVIVGTWDFFNPFYREI